MAYALHAHTNVSNASSLSCLLVRNPNPNPRNHDFSAELVPRRFHMKFAAWRCTFAEEWQNVRNWLNCDGPFHWTILRSKFTEKYPQFTERVESVSSTAFLEYVIGLDVTVEDVLELLIDMRFSRAVSLMVSTIESSKGRFVRENDYNYDRLLHAARECPKGTPETSSHDLPHSEERKVLHLIPDCGQLVGRGLSREKKENKDDNDECRDPLDLPALVNDLRHAATQVTPCFIAFQAPPGHPAGTGKTTAARFVAISHLSGCREMYENGFYCIGQQSSLCSVFLSKVGYASVCSTTLILLCAHK